MNEKYVTITSSIPIKDHTNLKAICSDRNVSIRAFVHGLIVKEIKKNVKPLYTSCIENGEN